MSKTKLKRGKNGQFIIGGGSFWKGKKFSDVYKKKLSDAHKKIGDKPPSRLGCIPWNKNFGVSDFRKNNKHDYANIHYWVNSRLGKADICNNCGSNKKVEWANKSHKYLKIKKDWVKLCKKCHVNYDYGKIKLKKTNIKMGE